MHANLLSLVSFQQAAFELFVCPSVSNGIIELMYERHSVHMLSDVSVASMCTVGVKLAACLLMESRTSDSILYLLSTSSLKSLDYAVIFEIFSGTIEDGLRGVDRGKNGMWWGRGGGGEGDGRCRFFFFSFTNGLWSC